MLRLVLSVWCLGSALGVPTNSSVFTPSYAKVANYGATSEARSAGQSLYTQRSDVKIRSGQNLRYQHGHSRIATGKADRIPGKGEVVLQDRFNPRPYFDYGVSDSKPAQDSKPLDSPVSSYAPVASEIPKDDPYNSPISSYNPAPSGLLSKPTPYQPSYSAGDNGGKHKFPGYVYDPPMQDSDDDQYTGPYAPPDDSKPSYGAQDADGSKPSYDAQDSDGSKPSYGAQNPDDSKPAYGADNAHPPKYIDDAHDHPPEDVHDHPPKYNHHDDVDLTPPLDTFPKSIPDFSNYDVPYNFDHHHHVYHEVKPTTTTEPPEQEDERVNKGHYSYYYLGRKLWYIPLYFSVYFIGYITVLILKSIARHKVEFAHDYKGNGRSFGGSEIDEASSGVKRHIDGFKRRYMAM